MLNGADRKEYDRLRGARKHDARPQVFRVRHHQRKVHLRLVEAPDPDRPRTRGDCIDGPRPCPWVSCRHHLYLEVSERTGSVRVYLPDVEPSEIEHSCSLDVADEGGTSLADIATMLNVTRERARQIESDAMRKLAPALDGWNDEDE